MRLKTRLAQEGPNASADRIAFWLTLAMCVVVSASINWVSEHLNKSYVSAPEETPDVEAPFDPLFAHSASEIVLNGFFDHDLAFWATSDGGTVHRRSASTQGISHRSVSNPFLEIRCSSGPCRYFLSSAAGFRVIDDPYAPSSPCWLATPDARSIGILFSYKGIGPTVWLNSLDMQGHWSPAEERQFPTVERWETAEAEFNLPQNSTRIGIEITFNNGIGLASLDDVQIVTGN